MRVRFHDDGLSVPGVAMRMWGETEDSREDGFGAKGEFESQQGPGERASPTDQTGKMGNEDFVISSRGSESSLAL
jgi:hypothetical protein